MKINNNTKLLIAITIVLIIIYIILLNTKIPIVRMEGFETAIIPKGSIILWSGSINSIPNGWVLCNGNNGSPDLSGKFVLGAGNGVDVNSVGGEKEKSLKIENLPEHSHNYRDRYYSEAWGQIDNNLPGSRTGNDNDNKAFYKMDRTQSSGQLNAKPFSIIPPYYALAYIMKL